MIRTPYAMAVNHHPSKLNNSGQQTSDVWDELRRAARPLENELEMKLVSFSKLGTGQHKRLNKTEEKEALLGASNSDHMFDTMSMEIERLLTKLTEVNDRMGEHLNNLSIGEPNPAQLHTMQRHRDILQDYSHEFVKTKANIKATKDREELLGSVQRDISDYKSGLSRRTDLYLKENEHLRSSERLADETIEIAMNTKENLSSQRKMFTNLSGRVINVANMFPSINSLVQKINIRKRRDALILGFVISVCLIIMLMYAFK
jgi:Golgi SNAP receptor complex protein 1